MQEGLPPQELPFQEGVASLLMGVEETRQRVVSAVATPLEVVHRLEDIWPLLFSLQPSDDVEEDLRKHCHDRSAQITLEALNYLTTKEESTSTDQPEASPDTERFFQGAVARVAEMSLLLHKENDDAILSSIIDTYVGYQRKVIRQRAKPSIAQLVALRKELNDPTSWVHQAQHHDDDAPPVTHTHVITTILGQASALVHPLLLWRAQLSPEGPHQQQLMRLCTESVKVVDSQAQTMVNTVATWYAQDKRLDSFWMTQAASETACAKDKMPELDALVDELAFSCQVFHRYLDMVPSDESAEASSDGKGTPSAIEALYAEWTWKYASLERHLTFQQLQLALQAAHPVQIVLGTPVRVPSVVEDAQYLSTRALERAASARSSQAIGTVAHAVASIVWSTDVTTGVFQSLVDQQGCYQHDIPQNEPPTKAAPSSFASALLGAVEEDLGSTPTSPPRSGRPPSAPSSGSFLGSLSSSMGGDRLLKIRMETLFCSLNGIHSASVACHSLVDFLDSLLPQDEDGNTIEDQASAMTQLAREELFRFSKGYDVLLKTQVLEAVTEFCGTAQDAPVYRGNYFLPILRYYLERDNYDLPNAEELRIAEDDARLHKTLMVPLEESTFLQQLPKCDTEVLRAICGELANQLGQLFFECITSKVVPKRFTDWGSLLFSKQVRLVRGYIHGLMEKSSDDACPALPQWEKLSQIVTALQLEMPSEWSMYQEISILTHDELNAVLSLRKDFSREAIAAVVASAKSNAQQQSNN